VVGFVRRDADEPSCATDLPTCDAGDVPSLVARERVERVIVASPVALRELIEDMALSSESNVRVEVIPELYEIFIGTVDSTVSDIPLMELTRPPLPAGSSARSAR